MIDHELPSTGERLPHDWALQDPDDWVTVLERGIPDVLERSRREGEEVVGLGIDFTSCTVLSDHADGVAAVHAGAVARAPARLAEAVEAPRGAAAWPTA